MTVIANYTGRQNDNYYVNVRNAKPSGKFGDAGVIMRFDTKEQAKTYAQQVKETGIWNLAKTQNFTAGLNPVQHQTPSRWQQLAYVQPANSIWDNLSNIGKLTPTENLKGLELFGTRLRNLGAMYVNPFAMGEYWRHLLTTGKFI